MTGLVIPSGLGYWLLPVYDLVGQLLPKTGGSAYRLILMNVEHLPPLVLPHSPVALPLPLPLLLPFGLRRCHQSWEG